MAIVHFAVSIYGYGPVLNALYVCFEVLLKIIYTGLLTVNLMDTFYYIIMFCGSGPARKTTHVTLVTIAFLSFLYGYIIIFIILYDYKYSVWPTNPRSAHLQLKPCTNCLFLVLFVGYIITFVHDLSLESDLSGSKIQHVL